MKGKIGQSLSYGLPVVTTTIGAEGMELVNGDHIVIADDADTFAHAVLRVYEDGALWTRLSRNGPAVVRDRWSPAAMQVRLEELLAFCRGRARAQAPPLQAAGG
jgi:O-antigen biosynthesis protein